MRGSAIECRIYAEDPANNFLPSPGRITQLAEPSGPGVRLDSGIYPGWNVPLDYDPMLAKLIVWADTREHAIERMLRALGEYYVGGIRTNIPLFSVILHDPAFRAGDLHTGYLDALLKRPGLLDLPADPGAGSDRGRGCCISHEACCGVDRTAEPTSRDGSAAVARICSDEARYSHQRRDCQCHFFRRHNCGS